MAFVNNTIELWIKYNLLSNNAYLAKNFINNHGVFHPGCPYKKVKSRI
jgi:hypothetical protein